MKSLPCLLTSALAFFLSSGLLSAAPQPMIPPDDELWESSYIPPY